MSSVKKYQVTKRNNSIVFSWKSPIEWYTVGISPGEYTMSELNKQLNNNISLTMGENAENVNSKNLVPKIIISPANIFIIAPELVVDIYQSSIRSVIGWLDSPNFEDSVIFLTEGNYSIDSYSEDVKYDTD